MVDDRAALDVARDIGTRVRDNPRIDAVALTAMIEEDPVRELVD